VGGLVEFSGAVYPGSTDFWGEDCRRFMASCLGMATRVSVATHSAMSVETFRASFSFEA